MNQHHARRSWPAFAVLVTGALAVQACATKGYVREQVRAQAVTTEADVAAARDSAIRAADQANATLETRVMTHVDSQIAGLRAELTTLRTEFNTRVTVMEDSIKLAMPIVFAFDDTTVRETSRPAIAGFAHIVKRYYPDARITIEGFADPAGSASYNMDLSRRRADAVRGALIEMGLDGTRLMTVGYGETRLVSPRAQKDDPGAELNRRVVFAIETVGSPITTAALVSGR
jgi:peptidoglycan-associated lipoprotein